MNGCGVLTCLNGCGVSGREVCGVVVGRGVVGTS